MEDTFSIGTIRKMTNGMKTQQQRISGPVLVSGRRPALCILWEVTCGDEDDPNARFREFYGWEHAPLQESSTLPYIRSERTPAEFTIKEESDDEASDGEEEDGVERNNEQGQAPDEKHASSIVISIGLFEIGYGLTFLFHL
ncbi:uncharacterized protein A4U43_C04F21490 [Asparagus officinalis]|uniref:Uncharacterized protein n=1 Tax=Asparagus officinalis TaxID=4686 RepID=A0A5P1F7D8_ASPOF|nr:uncharacterized protein A4U43_C04F21490 [Asparagus officinalis]